MANVRANRLLRLADRYGGIPLVAALGLRRKRALPDATEIRRIALLRISAIGDTLLLSGVLPDLRRQYPHATIILISGEDNAAAADLLQPVDERIVVRANRPLAAARAIRQSKPDVLVDFGPWPRLEAVLSALSGARYCIGFRTPGQGRHFAYDACVDHVSTVHEMENYRRLVSVLGVRATTPPSIVPRAATPATAPPRPYAVFHPWSGGFNGAVKEWPLERWTQLAERIAPRGWTIFVSGGPGDVSRSRELTAAIRARGISAVDAAGSVSLSELSGVLAGAEVVVSVNTGVMHLSALVGARTVSLEGPAPVTRWGPVGPRVRSVVTTLAGCGYLDLGFEYAGQRTDCMMGVEVDAVVRAIDELMR